MQSTLVSPFILGYNNKESFNLEKYKRCIHINIGKGAALQNQNSGTICIINDTNAEVIQFYQNLSSTQLQDQIERIAINWELIKEFNQLSSKEIFISYQDFENNIITLDDMQFMVRAIVLMNTDIDKFAALFSQTFSIIQDLFINSLIKSVINQISKIKGSFINSDLSNSLEQFCFEMETGFKSGFFNHFQNLINLQNTKLVDCIDKYNQLAIWYFISQTSKGCKVSYDNNGNLKNQYGGEIANKVDLRIPLNNIKRFFKEASGMHPSFYNLPYSDLLQEIKPDNEDFIIADFRTLNQIKTGAQEIKQNSVFNRVLNLLKSFSCNWMIIMDFDANLKEIAKNEDLVYNLYKENKAEWVAISKIL